MAMDMREGLMRDLKTAVAVTVLIWLYEDPLVLNHMLNSVTVNWSLSLWRYSSLLGIRETQNKATMSHYTCPLEKLLPCNWNSHIIGRHVQWWNHFKKQFNSSCKIKQIPLTPTITISNFISVYSLKKNTMPIRSVTQNTHRHFILNTKKLGNKSWEDDCEVHIIRKLFINKINELVLHIAWTNLTVLCWVEESRHKARSVGTHL